MNVLFNVPPVYPAEQRALWLKPGMFVRSLRGNPGVFQQDRIGSNNTRPDQDVTPQVVGRGDSNQEKKNKGPRL